MENAAHLCKLEVNRVVGVIDTGRLERLRNRRRTTEIRLFIRDQRRQDMIKGMFGTHADRRPHRSRSRAWKILPGFNGHPQATIDVLPVGSSEQCPRAEKC
jgi:hypothetical protein